MKRRTKMSLYSNVDKERIWYLNNVKVLFELFASVHSEEEFRAVLNYYLSSTNLTRMDLKWSEYCLSLMHLLLIAFLDYKHVIMEVVH